MVKVATGNVVMLDPSAKWRGEWKGGEWKGVGWKGGRGLDNYKDNKRKRGYGKEEAFEVRWKEIHMITERRKKA